MTPIVRDILIEARKRIHAEIADRACVSDTQAMFILDQLLTADAQRDLASASREEVVCGLSDDTPNPHEEAERRELEKKLADLERQREQDDKLIKGLQEELKRRRA